ncbi:hypothetical protein EB796_017544 [Bugula neritina]|uniref:Uncharacterized protein n=1 Tax=Bugula neritina TaxID=10212 RepID=A0A7J7JD03_BUGNE|nr:hypothetical protein EB796_017544 [Bugula neritina]
MFADRVEFGDASTVPLLNPIPAAASAAQQSLTLKQLRQKEEEEMWGPSVDGPGLEALNLDDFFIMKAASESQLTVFCLYSKNIFPYFLYIIYQ